MNLRPPMHRLSYGDRDQDAPGAVDQTAVTSPAGTKMSVMRHGVLGKRNLDGSSSTQPACGPAFREVSLAATPMPTCMHRSPAASHQSHVPPTPQESPRFQIDKHRSEGPCEHFADPPCHPSALSSYDSAPIRFCLCPAEPKIKRPPNSFMLYRKSCQNTIRLENPGATNPEISKIIGLRWHHETPEVQAHFKAHAERAKLQHQKDYPTYRFQPRKRHRPDATALGAPFTKESDMCEKCEGRIVRPALSSLRSMDAPAASRFPGASLSAIREPKPGPPEHMQTHGYFHRQLPRLQHTPPDSGSWHSRPSRSPSQEFDHKRRRLDDWEPSTMHHRPLHSFATDAGVEQADSHLQYRSAPGHAHALSPRHVFEAAGQMRAPSRPPTHDPSLTLPPLQLDSAANAPESARTRNLVDELMKKVSTLREIAPPSRVDAASLRGPLVAIEGNDAHSVQELASWLQMTLDKDDDLAVTLCEGPQTAVSGSARSMMQQCHLLAADWLGKSDAIMASLAMPGRHQPLSEKGSSADTTDGRSTTRMSPPMQEDRPQAQQVASALKPIVIIANYSLHATEFFWRNIALSADDHYSSFAHWQWVATQWRGIAGPDLTIYVRWSADDRETSVLVHAERNLFIVNLPSADRGDGRAESAWRRLRFEVGEWIRAFGMPQ